MAATLGVTVSLSFRVRPQWPHIIPTLNLENPLSMRRAYVRRMHTTELRKNRETYDLIPPEDAIA